MNHGFGVSIDYCMRIVLHEEPRQYISGHTASVVRTVPAPGFSYRPRDLLGVVPWCHILPDARCLTCAYTSIFVHHETGAVKHDTGTRPQFLTESLPL